MSSPMMWTAITEPIKPQLHLLENTIVSACTCPYPGEGCKHVVAAIMNTRQVLLENQITEEDCDDTPTPYFSEKEIIEQAMEDRDKKS